MSELTDLTNLTLLAIIKAITVILGLVIIYQGAKAYRTTRRKPLLFLTLGMAVMTVGAISEAVSYQGLSRFFDRGLQWTLDQSHLFEALVTLIAFIILVYSLYVKE